MTAYAWGRLFEAVFALSAILMSGACVALELADRREARWEKRLRAESARQAKALYRQGVR